eukprot:5261374-Pleurochrysis_carterae.AAC.1
MTSRFWRRPPTHSGTWEILLLCFSTVQRRYRPLQRRLVRFPTRPRLNPSQLFRDGTYIVFTWSVLDFRLVFE